MQSILGYEKKQGTTVLKTGLVAAAITALAGCASGGGPGPSGGADQNPAGSGQAASGQSHAQGQGDKTVARGLRGIPSEDRAKFKDPDSPLSTRTLYFKFDRSSVKSKYAKVIRAHAQYLAKHPEVHMRVEGHTDPRGTREYNIALGSRRAKSVTQALTMSNAKSSQISTLSFGEERPAVMGDTKSDYAKDRRVVLVYTNNQ
ncbi:peptidoglycan-associated lipoprotein Pal [Salinisphaera sp. USBA-960]|uniref:peptidoglycan-associated lipoprotein Pal n=1 Tax=Salinisphaera orenii TaxID=856731 RepID=UPI000DBE82FB|nr:peptidoglycan-associated lipoprotein Pal [Salifodinibacter halophilus]NNC25993.1 peptidoglycan-associated lipoprotein Pal [Salifodinibacter halophilus]